MLEIEILRRERDDAAAECDALRRERDRAFKKFDALRRELSAADAERDDALLLATRLKADNRILTRQLNTLREKPIAKLFSANSLDRVDRIPRETEQSDSELTTASEPDKSCR